ncbi:MAG: hypothetical protein JL50_08585 [Peptococcaceae bacterium BICA1-7]|nr:MAG: hypothetical protein JL50_08585 [Peptococcaceae bacterium BICA1-7]HBV97380.1 hypothetical protein [Desulfotomaculum sp.]
MKMLPKKIIMVALIAFFILVITVPAFADGLPLDVLKQGGITDSSFGGAQVASPFIKLINWGIAILATIFLGYAIFHMVLRVKDLISGKRQWKAMLDDFISIGAAIVVLAISITGSWYDLINWFHVNVILKIVEAFH